MPTGQFDPVTGQMVLGGISRETRLANNRYFMTSSVDGKQIPVGKPEALIAKPSLNDTLLDKYPRTYLRNETVKNIYSQYDRVADDVLIHKATGEVVTGPIDIGHRYGWEHRRLDAAAREVGLSRPEFNDYVNSRPEMFRLENRSDNRSHRNEMPGTDGIERIINDMKTFKKGK